MPSETIPESRSWSAGETVTVIPVHMRKTRTADNKWESQTGPFCLNQSNRASVSLRTLSRLWEKGPAMRLHLGKDEVELSGETNRAMLQQRVFRLGAIPAM